MSLILPLLLCAMAELPASSEVRPIPVTGVVVDGSGQRGSRWSIFREFSGPMIRRSD